MSEVFEDVVNFLVFRNLGEVYTIGKNVDNYLGIGTWTGRDDNEHWRYHTLQRVVFPDDVKIAGITASMGCTIAWTEDGRLFLNMHLFNQLFRESLRFWLR